MCFKQRPTFTTNESYTRWWLLTSFVCIFRQCREFLREKFRLEERETMNVCYGTKRYWWKRNAWRRQAIGMQTLTSILRKYIRLWMVTCLWQNLAVFWLKTKKLDAWNGAGRRWKYSGCHLTASHRSKQNWYSYVLMQLYGKVYVSFKGEWPKEN